jgi:hypothetical protein
MPTASEQVARDLRAKMRLEAAMRPKVKALFKRMVKAHVRSVNSNGLPLNAQDFKQDWTDLLLDHYRVTQGIFIGSVKAFQAKELAGLQYKQEDDEEGLRAEEILAGALLMWSERQAPRQAQFITDTSVKNVADSMRLARETLLEQEEEITDRAMAATSGRLLERDFAGRVDSIVMTETQSAAETTKIMEAYSLSDINPNVMLGGSVVVSTTTKRWQTVGDNKVRGAHVTANGQTRLLHQPFDVGGEQLRYPGDSGLGATPKNTANCRCSSIYRI